MSRFVHVTRLKIENSRVKKSNKSEFFINLGDKPIRFMNSCI
jgi:hypothetical protein